MNKLKWLYPGIGIKRWILLIIVGLFLVSSGLVLMTDIHLSVLLEQSIMYFSRFFAVRSTGLFKIGLGLLFAGIGVYMVLWSLGKIEKVVSKKILSEDELVDILYEENFLKKGPRVVSLGGGTGLSNLLRGIKKYTSNITAIVTVADDGGSSGKLRDEMGILPPGDIRNCLIALADIEPLMQKLMQYRFENEGHLAGHSFGNLFIASMNEIVEGEFEEAVKESSKVLAIKGQVLPVTNENIQLGAVYADD
ncbi:MAG: gluconeogenesis factor YvcK family protein, partial [Halanaerobiales bacterium]